MSMLLIALAAAVTAAWKALACGMARRPARDE